MADAEKLYVMFRTLGVEPKADSAKDLDEWMLQYLMTRHPELSEESGTADPGRAVKVEPNPTQPPTKVVNNHFPRIPTFSGDGNKGDISFELWIYEVECLLEEQTHSPENIKQAMRSSLRGSAANTLRRLGTVATTKQILRKLYNVYGAVELKENLMTEFYRACQEPDETVMNWSCRLEDLTLRLQNKNKLPPHTVQEMLRERFWNGLHKPLRDETRYQYETIKDFDDFRREVRSAEHQLNLNKPARVKAQQHQSTTPAEQPSTSNPSTTDKLLMEIRAEMKSLRTDVDEIKSKHNAVGDKVRNFGPMKRDGECYRCGRKGHFRDNCHATTDIQGKSLMEGHSNQSRRDDIRCLRCGRNGHKQEDCYATKNIRGQPLNNQPLNGR